MSAQLKTIAFVAAAVMAALIAAPASAATVYSAVGDFSTTSATGVWSYGTGVTGTSFTAMPDFSAACEGAAGISCWQVADPVNRVPLVAKNVSGGAMHVFGTVTQPTDVLNVHPGPSTDGIVRFTAQTSGEYSVTGFFQTLDTNPNGVVVDIFKNGTSEMSQAFQGAAATNTAAGGVLNFNDKIYLAAGDHLDFGVNNGGSYFNDSTGLAATITAVPEPSTWGLMLVGLGAVGAVVRGSRRRAMLAA